jgi:hypothetical protein
MAGSSHERRVALAPFEGRGPVQPRESNMKKLVELELSTDEKTGLKISLDPDLVAVIEDLPDNDEACKIICENKSEYVVIGKRGVVAKKLKK